MAWEGFTLSQWMASSEGPLQDGCQPGSQLIQVVRQGRGLHHQRLLVGGRGKGRAIEKSTHGLERGPGLPQPDVEVLPHQVYRSPILAAARFPGEKQLVLVALVSAAAICREQRLQHPKELCPGVAQARPFRIDRRRRSVARVIFSADFSRHQGLPQALGQAARWLPYPVQVSLGQLESELAGGCVLQVVGLVDDHRLVVGNQAPTIGQVAHQEGMVDDDDVGLLRPLAGRSQEAG